MKIVLLTAHDTRATADRQCELEQCLRANLANERIERVVVFASGRTPNIDDERVDTIPVAGRPTYGQLFRYASKRLSGQVCLIAHGDTTFDESLDYFDDVDFDLTSLVFGGGSTRPFRALAFREALDGVGDEIMLGDENAEARLIGELPERLTVRDVRTEVRAVHRDQAGESSEHPVDHGQPAIVPPVPAASPKVWGIGLQRTGTSSFRRALNLLGITTLEHSGAWFLVRLRDGRLVFEPRANQTYFQGFADSPVPLFFREIDSMFPGSKFILTTRRPESWLRSVETLFLAKRHWDRTAEGELYNALHELSYGVTEFDREAFLAGYRRHEVQVRDYFRDRPDDLLVLDCSEPEKWPKLCKFLGRPMPQVPYPHVHRDTSRVVWAVRRFLNWIPRPAALRAR